MHVEFEMTYLLSGEYILTCLCNLFQFEHFFLFLISRMLQKSLGHTPSLAHLDKVNSNSLDSCVPIQDAPPTDTPYSKPQDVAGSHISARLTPSPAPVLNIDSPSTYTSDGSPLLYPKLSSIHRSMESLSLQMSVPSRFVKAESHDIEERGRGTWGAASRTSLNQTDG